MGTENLPKPFWHGTGKTVQGASHIRVGLPNQDAIEQWPESNEGPPFILAVSDGHGSAKSFRSHEGARFAVKTAIEVMQAFLEGEHDFSNVAALKRTVDEHLPKRLVHEWRTAVETHLAENPFEADEKWAQLVETEGATAQKAVEANPLLAYGATLLTVLVTESFILYLQLGDGDILCVDANGETTRPLPTDEKLIANETTSLCSPNAWEEVRVRLVTSENPPALILATTDGYANSFTSEREFLRLGSDYLQMIRYDGISQVEQELGAILKEASEIGSGDDITLGIIKRAEEMDQDTYNRRLTAVESAQVGQQQATRQVQRQLADVQDSLQSKAEYQQVEALESKMNNQNTQIKSLTKSTATLRWGFLLALFLAVVGLALVAGLWFRFDTISAIVAGIKKNQPPQKTEWRVINASLPNDANVSSLASIDWWPKSGGGERQILAVSKGLPQPQNIRGAVGAKLATQTAMDSIHTFITTEQFKLSKAETALPMALMLKWKIGVETHFQNNPLLSKEEEILENTGTRIEESTTPPIYQATLLAAMVTETDILYLKSGEGVIITVSGLGEVTKRLTRGKKSDTTGDLSLNSVFPMLEAQKLTPDSPALLLLATDALADQVNLQEFGKNLLHQIRQSNTDQVKEYLQKQFGTGDVAIGVIYREDVAELSNP
jgi:serine/threonine protein phosphatase PrpC